MSFKAQVPAGKRFAVPAPGEVIASKYEVESVLGAGGMGVVLCARHVQLGQRVAIKFLHGEASHNQSAVARFLREARAAVALSSEHVARVLDVGTLATGEPYTVMEYLAGVDLRELLRTDGPLPIEEAVSTLLQACDAIAEAHVLGIVHRDLKPSNLFRTARRDGTSLVKVLDFGISKATAFNSPGDNEDLTASGRLIGSPGYMSPEQLRNAKTVDTRSDIWSLGVILYELLTGQPPFKGETMGETFVHIVSQPPPSIRRLRPEVPEGLAAVVSGCLDRDVDARIQTIGDLAARLAPFGPKDMALLGERIARISASGTIRVAQAEASSAPDTMTATPSSGSHSPRSPLVGTVPDTGPPWLKSAPVWRHQRSARAIAIASMIAAALVGAAVGIHGLGRRPKPVAPLASGREASTGSPAAASAAASGREADSTLSPEPAESARVETATDAGSLPLRPIAPKAPARIETRQVTPNRPTQRRFDDPLPEDLLEDRR
jgi:serine/threonine-protein kinase